MDNSNNNVGPIYHPPTSHPTTRLLRHILSWEEEEDEKEMQFPQRKVLRSRNLGCKIDWPYLHFYVSLGFGRLLVIPETQKGEARRAQTFLSLHSHIIIYGKLWVKRRKSTFKINSIQFRDSFCAYVFPQSRKVERVEKWKKLLLLLLLRRL